MDKDQVQWMMIYYAMSPATAASRSRYSRIMDFVEGAQSRVIFLLGHRRGEEFAQGIYDENLTTKHLRPQGPFHGVGEIGFYLPELQEVTFGGPMMQTVFRGVDEKGGIVMIHPRDGSQDLFWRPEDSTELEEALQSYPNTTFLFHGHPTVQERYILPLMSEYPKVYFTLDVAHMLATYPPRKNAHKKPLHGSPDFVERWLAYVNEIGVDTIVEGRINDTRAWFEQHPDRIVWGTDRLRSTWEEPVSDMFIEIGRRYIARLPADVQEAYAYENALRVFGKYLIPKQ